MRTEITYIADDGTRFDDMKKCEEYEEITVKAINLAKQIKAICSEHINCEVTCPFYNSNKYRICKIGCEEENFFPSDWEV